MRAGRSSLAKRTTSPTFKSPAVFAVEFMEKNLRLVPKLGNYCLVGVTLLPDEGVAQAELPLPALTRLARVPAEVPGARQAGPEDHHRRADGHPAVRHHLLARGQARVVVHLPEPVRVPAVARAPVMHPLPLLTREPRAVVAAAVVDPLGVVALVARDGREEERRARAVVVVLEERRLLEAHRGDVERDVVQVLWVGPRRPGGHGGEDVGGELEENGHGAPLMPCSNGRIRTMVPARVVSAFS